MVPQKKIAATVRIEQNGGAAEISKLGPVMGPHGVNIGLVARAFDEATREYRGLRVPADVVIYEDRSVEVVAKKPTTASLLKKHLAIESGSKTPGISQVGTISQETLKEIATVKMDDLNTDSIEAAMSIVAGTARSMGVKVAD